MIRGRNRINCLTVSYNLDEELIGHIVELARKLKMSRSQVVESLIRSGLEHEARCARFAPVDGCDGRRKDVS